MKDFIIIMFILTFVLTGNIIINNILEKDSGKIIDTLKHLEENIGDESIANEKAEELYNLWQDTEEKWSIIVDHQELDAIKAAILTANAAIKVGDAKVGYEQIENYIFLVGHIKDKLTVEWKNIF